MSRLFVSAFPVNEKLITTYKACVRKEGREYFTTSSLLIEVIKKVLKIKIVKLS